MFAIKGSTTAVMALALAGCGGNADGSSGPALTGGDAGPLPPSYVPPGAGGFVTSLPSGSGGVPSPGSGGAAPSVGTGGASAGGLVGSGGAADGATPGGNSGAPNHAAPPCVNDPTTVAIVGDSYVTGALSPALQPALGMQYPAANSFRNYAVPGTSLASGGLAGFIGSQMDLALTTKTNLLIMDGGGNDILICDSAKYPGCSTLCNQAGSASQKVCTDIVAAAMDEAEALFQQAAKAGVRDVVYFFYPHVPNSFGGFKDMIDYGEKIARDKCEGTFAESGGTLTCHFVDLVKPFIDAGGDMNPLNFSIDGIHPSAAGQDIIAKQIWGMMQKECLGQPTSGCCTP